VAQLPLALDRLGCDFYCASCHKWLCAPFGSGFLYAAPAFQDRLAPPRLSWGRLPPRAVEHWSHEFIWCGTRDPSPYLAVPAAIEFLRQAGLEAFRKATHTLAAYARNRLVDRFGLQPITPDSTTWYASMAHAPIPACEAVPLQQRLWQEHRIEVPIIAWQGRTWVRVSCHLYNTRRDIDRLTDAMGRCVGG
jgi:isopenicillin-N epimerase